MSVNSDLSLGIFGISDWAIIMRRYLLFLHGGLDDFWLPAAAFLMRYRYRFDCQ